MSERARKEFTLWTTAKVFYFFCKAKGLHPIMSKLNWFMLLGGRYDVEYDVISLESKETETSSATESEP
jgi:hypothetical protein